MADTITQDALLVKVNIIAPQKKLTELLTEATIGVYSKRETGKWRGNTASEYPKHCIFILSPPPR